MSRGYNQITVQTLQLLKAPKACSIKAYCHSSISRHFAFEKSEAAEEFTLILKLMKTTK